MKRDALFNMIEQQIRPWDVHDTAVLAALNDVPRAPFLPITHRSFAYMDTDLPLVIDGVDTGTRLLPPRVVARIVQSLSLQSTDEVGLVGLGDGYLAALLARFARSVTVYELDERTLQFAQKNLNAHHVRNINFELSDGLKHSSEKFDAFVLAGSVSVLTDAIKQKIKVSGRMFAVIGAADAPVMHACLVERESENSWSSTVLFETLVPALKQPNPSNTFRF
ncbi:protein-L-isoaspartate O-methyltransferase [Formosimonas limnophila]|uniref:Protein-L-isoaspartate O-methyltransferase n=1 Tax=Formosimonas limnophila TaxID=1384487 RepID=A0A8J3CP18_9BURK|nr:methyltransferase [Formosimonas limnophila]GHA79033.1 protein-L-isoaspartate O-methyltransferase [Formosimonas limnophila]